MTKQLEFFEKTVEEKMDEFEDKMDRRSKSLFAKSTEQDRKIDEMRHQFDLIIAAMSKSGRLFV